MSRALSGRLGVYACWKAKPLRTLSISARYFSNSTTWLHTPHTEHFEVPCASSGHVTVSLHDTSEHPALSPLIINLPAFPVQDISDVDSYLPRFLRPYPSATIHYRWPHRGHHTASISSQKSGDEQQGDLFDAPLHWPTPIHDTLAGYDFLTRELAPPPHRENGHSRLQRRDIYVYGSFLGAGLAASLALTESHANEPMAVRGLLAINGVYNWTTFLPEHPLNTARQKLAKELGLDLAAFERREDTDQDLGMLKALLPLLFHQPGDLFDPFASPVLFFHTAGMMVPPSFTERWRPEYLSDPTTSSSSSPNSDSEDIDPYDYVYSDPEDPPPPMPFPETESTDTEETHSDSDSSTDISDDPTTDATSAMMAPAPRRGYLAFPPRASSLKIPDTLLLHSTAPPLPDVPDTVVGQRQLTSVWKKLRNADNSFASQAMGLAGLMRRSVNKLEVKERVRWDEDFEDPEGEALRRVETRDIGEEGVLGQEAETEERARQWLEERLG